MLASHKKMPASIRTKALNMSRKTARDSTLIKTAQQPVHPAQVFLKKKSPGLEIEPDTNAELVLVHVLCPHAPLT